MKKLVYVATVDWFFISHRLPLAEAAVKAGYDVTVVAKDTGCSDEIREVGAKFYNLDFSRSGRNPFGELNTVNKLRLAIKELRPDVLHLVSLKPVIYGGIAAWFVAPKAKRISAVTGFGHLFSGDSVPKIVQSGVRRFLKMLWKSPKTHVIVQNSDHEQELLDFGLIDSKRIHLIEGAGIDINEFTPIDKRFSPPVVVLPARMLKAKGILEFAEAAKILRDAGREERFVLVGAAGDDNPTALSEQDLFELEKETGVEWWGHRTDIREILQKSALVVLPSSYGEGMPKALLEAMACGKPIVTTDIPGCRQLVGGNNGILVQPKSVLELSKAIEVALQPAFSSRAGKISRELVVTRFSLDRVIESTLRLY